MSTPKKITFNFWRIEMPASEPRTFESLIKKASEIDNLEDRIRDLSNFPVRMEKSEHSNNVWIGEMLKLRMDELPVKASRSSPIEDLGLDADEGVAEPNGFLFDPATKVLITHGEHYGVSASKIAEYFGEIGVVRGEIKIEPVPTEEGWAKFSSMKDIKALTFRIGSSINPALLPKEGRGLRNIIERLADYNGLQMELTVSVGRVRSHSLDKNTIELDIAALLACHDADNNAVDKVEGKGVDDDGNSKSFDFLEGRMRYVANVKLGEERRITYSTRRTHLSDAYRKNIEEIERLYSE